MHFKLLLLFVEDDKTDKIMEAARDAGATGATAGVAGAKLTFVFLLPSNIKQYPKLSFTPTRTESGPLE